MFAILENYEDATEIVDLLAGNESILIDFQYMTEVQARRCLDYLDGARHVLAGELRKVANTMYLLTPVGVVVNIEDIRLPEETQSEEYDFDMKRNRVRYVSNNSFYPKCYRYLFIDTCSFCSIIMVSKCL